MRLHNLAWGVFITAVLVALLMAVLGAPEAESQVPSPGFTPVITLYLPIIVSGSVLIPAPTPTPTPAPTPTPSPTPTCTVTVTRIAPVNWSALGGAGYSREGAHRADLGIHYWNADLLVQTFHGLITDGLYLWGFWRQYYIYELPRSTVISASLLLPVELLAADPATAGVTITVNAGTWQGEITATQECWTGWLTPAIGAAPMPAEPMTVEIPLITVPERIVIRLSCEDAPCLSGEDESDWNFNVGGARAILQVNYLEEVTR